MAEKMLLYQILFSPRCKVKDIKKIWHHSDITKLKVACLNIEIRIYQWQNKI